MMIYALVCGAILTGIFETHAQDTGDINDDGNMNLADAVLALQILVLSEVQDDINLNADVNNDKNIGLEEAIYILQKLCVVFPPSCIADLNNWKVDFQPQNSDCMKCHTTCTPASRHKFCDEGESWEVSESKCLNCHGSAHSE